MIIIDGSERFILSLKLILYCFEWLSGLKINYHKSDIYVFEEDQERKEVLANMLNCRLGEWPMKYLELSISEHMAGSHAFTGLVDKMRKKLDPWKGRNLSLVGRLFTRRWIILGVISSGKARGKNQISYGQNGHDLQAQEPGRFGHD